MAPLFRIQLLFLLAMSLPGCAYLTTANLGEILPEGSNEDLSKYKFDRLSNGYDRITAAVAEHEKQKNDFEISRESNGAEFDSSSLDRSNSSIKPLPLDIAAAAEQQRESRQIQNQFEPGNAIRPLRTASLPAKPINANRSPVQRQQSTILKALPIVAADSQVRTAKGLASSIEDPNPPFAHHPAAAFIDFEAALQKLVDYETLIPERQQQEQLSDAADEFLEQLIADSSQRMLQPIELVSAKTAATPSPNAEPGLAFSAGGSKHEISWASQLEQTISVFETEHALASEAARKSELIKSLSILRAIQSSLAIQNEAVEIEPELQLYWSHQIDALNTVMSPGDNSRDDTAADALEHLSQAAEGLRQLAELRLSSSCLCRKVSGFGQYDPFENTSFPVGQEALLYCEIENFTPVQSTDRRSPSYKTQISSKFWIEDSSGKEVQRYDFPAVSDYAKKPRIDFYMHVPVRFDLPPGPYTIHLEITDHGSNKSASLPHPIPFSIR